MCSDHVSTDFPRIVFLRNKNLEEQGLYLCSQNWSECCDLKLCFEYRIYYSKIAIRNLIALLNPFMNLLELWCWNCLAMWTNSHRFVLEVEICKGYLFLDLDLLYLYCCWALYSVNPSFSANNDASALHYLVIYLLYCKKCVSFVHFEYDFIQVSA